LKRRRSCSDINTKETHLLANFHRVISCPAIMTGVICSRGREQDTGGSLMSTHAPGPQEISFGAIASAKAKVNFKTLDKIIFQEYISIRCLQAASISQY
jgi:hypothetical protein